MVWKNIVVDYEQKALLDRISIQKQQLDAYRPIPDYIIRNIRENLDLEWTYNSNSIEGNTLTLVETHLVVQDGLTIGGKSLREHLEIVNHQEAIHYIEKISKKDFVLTKRDILQLHALVLDKIDKNIAGTYRTSGVRISGANFTPPDALFIEELLDELITWYTIEAKDMHPVIKASIFHHRFVWIHPFYDGNGRTIRLLYNLLLMNEGYPPAIILKVDRKKYYAALNLANTYNYSKLIFLIAQATERSLSIYLSNLEDRSSGYKPIPDIVSEPEIPYGQEYVSLLARKGKIEAYKEGRVWYTRKEAILAYRDKRLRKR
jgi:Fic family protein